jgi:tetrahydromethanopterin S-methyltransferase subunit B
MDDKAFLTTEYESEMKREELASARGVVIGTFFGFCLWLGALALFKLVVYVTTSIRTILT